MTAGKPVVVDEREHTFGGDSRNSHFKDAADKSRADMAGILRLRMQSHDDLTFPEPYGYGDD